jgi:hypothetical protein
MGTSSGAPVSKPIGAEPSRSVQLSKSENVPSIAELPGRMPVRSVAAVAEPVARVPDVNEKSSGEKSRSVSSGYATIVEDAQVIAFGESQIQQAEMEAVGDEMEVLEGELKFQTVLDSIVEAYEVNMYVLLTTCMDLLDMSCDIWARLIPMKTSCLISG